MKSPIEYIKESFKIYTKKENFIFFAKIMAVLTIISAIIEYPFLYYKNNYDYLTLITGVLMFMVGIWVKSTTYFAIFKIGNSEKDIFKLGYKNMFRLLVISLTVGLLVGLGVILLFIPAIIFGVWYSFSVWLVLDKEMKIGEALKTSKAMVKGRFWKVLGRSFVLGLFTAIAVILLSPIPYAGNLVLSFTAPLYMLPFYLLYRDLSAGLNDLGTV